MSCSWGAIVNVNRLLPFGWLRGRLDGERGSFGGLVFARNLFLRPGAVGAGCFAVATHLVAFTAFARACNTWTCARSLWLGRCGWLGRDGTRGAVDGHLDIVSDARGDQPVVAVAFLLFGNLPLFLVPGQSLCHVIELLSALSAYLYSCWNVYHRQAQRPFRSGGILE